MTSKDVMSILSRSLNMIDARLVDHGQRVAYIVLKMLTKENKYTGKELHKIIFLSALHDIGAFKTEEIDTLTDAFSHTFELKNTLQHAVYGYLFIKNFTILKEYADAILFHHFPYSTLKEENCEYKDLAAKIFIADRLDILMNSGNLKINEHLFSHFRGTLFDASDIDSLIALEKECNLTEMLKSGKYIQEMDALYENMHFSESDLLSFLVTMGYLIDFRSEYTVLHNITTVSLSIEIARLLRLSREEINKIYYGATLHDLGKISTSIGILEKAGTLNDYEYQTMKDHVVVSEYILKGSVDEEILQIAIRHHEKLDGSGYPHGLTEKDLTISQQIVGIADISSALYGRRSYKEPFPPIKIIDILTKMADGGKLSKEIVELVVRNFDDLIAGMDVHSEKVITNYHRIKVDYEELCLRYSSVD